MKCHDHIHQPDCCTATAVSGLEEKLANRIHALELVSGRLNKRLYDLETDTKFGYLDSSLTTLCQRIDKVESAIEGLSATVRDDQLLLPCAHCGCKRINSLTEPGIKTIVIQCSNKFCGCRMEKKYAHDQDIVKAWDMLNVAWNTRA